MIRVAIVGVGNCASALYQGLHYYSDSEASSRNNNGLMRHDIGGYSPKNIEVVAAFDVDARKVGKCFREAMLSEPNCTPVYCDVADGPEVLKGPILDGVSPHMELAPAAEGFRVSSVPPVDVCTVLREKMVDILINYLPVGSQKATEHYAECCLATDTSFLNCIPVFIASNPVWADRFYNAGIPIIGDDMKSQLGASIVSQALQELALTRGHHVKCHIQQNVGGNTDFLNMSNADRVTTKKTSKENVIREQNVLLGKDQTYCHAGPSEYIRYYKDNKIATLHMEMEGFMSAPVTLDVKMSVIDSPNSAGVVMDAIRYLKVARDRGISGALEGPSAFTQKTPPKFMSYADALNACEQF